MNRTPRYDGLADWYDAEIQRLGITNTAVSALTGMLGSGNGRCLDLGCGTGILIPHLMRLGWSVVGVDISEDQLRVARQRLSSDAVSLVQADAAQLPFESQSFDAVVSLFTHTDWDRPQAVFREAARVLCPDGRLIYLGTHPCFITPYVERRHEAPHLLHPGYRSTGWTATGPGLGHGIRPRVGVNHYPLATLLQLIIDAGLCLTRVEEPGEEDYPLLFGLAASYRTPA